MVKIKALAKRSFFGKSNCFKFILYENATVFFHFGTEKNNSWSWKKVKMNDIELADILLVLENKKEKTSFFHSFGEKQKNTTQIWINRKDKKSFFIE